jgi:hypothetical protein
MGVYLPRHGGVKSEDKELDRIIDQSRKAEKATQREREAKERRELDELALEASRHIMHQFGLPDSSPPTYSGVRQSKAWIAMRPTELTVLVRLAENGPQSAQTLTDDWHGKGQRGRYPTIHDALDELNSASLVRTAKRKAGDPPRAIRFGLTMFGFLAALNSRELEFWESPDRVGGLLRANGHLHPLFAQWQNISKEDPQLALAVFREAVRSMSEWTAVTFKRGFHADIWLAARLLPLMERYFFWEMLCLRPPASAWEADFARVAGVDMDHRKKWLRILSKNKAVRPLVAEVLKQNAGEALRAWAYAQFAFDSFEGKKSGEAIQRALRKSVTPPQE